MVAAPVLAAVTARAQASVRRAGAAAAADHSDGERGPAHTLRRIGDLVDEPALRVGQSQHIFRPDLHALPPDVRGVLVAPDEHHALPAARLRGIAEPRRRPPGPAGPLPAASACGRRVMNLWLRSGGRAQPQQIVEQFHILGHDQRSAAPLFGDRQTVPCDGFGHDLRPLLPAPSPRFRGDLGAFRDRRYPEPADFAGGITVQRFGKSCGSCSKTVDNSTVVNISVTQTGDFRRAALPLHTVTSRGWFESAEKRAVAAEKEAECLIPSARKCVRTCDDPRRGGERGSSPRPTRGGGVGPG